MPKFWHPIRTLPRRTQRSGFALTARNSPARPPGMAMKLICRTTFALAVACCLNAASAQQPAAPATRIWTAASGQKFQAKLTGLEGTNAVFQLLNGQVTKVPLNLLSAADQTAARGSATANPASGKEKPAAPAKERTWPVIVEVPPNSIEITVGEQDAAKRRYVYKSQAFEFVSQDKLAGSVMKEVARTFEATRALVSALPWNVSPKPPEDLGYYQAKLFVTREDYFADGGPQNSGGVYMSGDRVFRIPFPSLGLQLHGKTWFKKTDYRSDTLVHEVTHQMMHELLPFLPKWVIEGTAEYTESLPYNAGRFLAGSHARGMKDYLGSESVKRMSAARFPSFPEHMQVTHDAWESRSSSAGGQHQLYVQSYILVYYFCHLDGDGKGTRFLKYLDAIAGARNDWERFFKNPQVTVRKDGSYTYPSTLPRPDAKRSEEFGIGKMDILFDGRDAATLEADIRNGYKKLGIKL